MQYFKWLWQVVRGDFGWSTSNSEPVIQAILERLPATLELMGCAFVFSLGDRRRVRASSARCASTRGWTTSITTLAFFGQSMPVFWFALMMQLAFSVVGITAFGYNSRCRRPASRASDNFDLGTGCSI